LKLVKHPLLEAELRFYCQPVFRPADEFSRRLSFRWNETLKYCIILGMRVIFKPFKASAVSAARCFAVMLFFTDFPQTAGKNHEPRLF
ncbi:MAG: hypothetical protein WBV21_20535, partial [Desulfobacterales bacterium]